MRHDYVLIWQVETRRRASLCSGVDCSCLSMYSTCVSDNRLPCSDIRRRDVFGRARYRYFGEITRPNNAVWSPYQNTMGKITSLLAQAVTVTNCIPRASVGCLGRGVGRVRAVLRHLPQSLPAKSVTVRSEVVVAVTAWIMVDMFWRFGKMCFLVHQCRCSPIWKVSMWLPDYTTSLARRLLCIFISQIRPVALRSKSFAIHVSPLIPPFNAVQL
jgi:hypothetical protein